MLTVAVPDRYAAVTVTHPFAGLRRQTGSASSGRVACSSLCVFVRGGEGIHDGLDEPIADRWAADEAGGEQRAVEPGEVVLAQRGRRSASRSLSSERRLSITS